MKRGNLDTKAHTQEENHVKLGAMLSQAKELPEARREAWDGSLPSFFRGSIALPAP